METVAKESENMRGGNSDSMLDDSDINSISSYGSSYCYGYKIQYVQVQNCQVLCLSKGGKRFQIKAEDRVELENISH